MKGVMLLGRFVSNQADMMPYEAFLARATEGTSLYVWVRQSVSQSVSQCVSVFQNSYQCTSRLCRELRFCLELAHTS